MYSGKLFVVGKNKIEIEVGHCEPKNIVVRFKNENIPTCSPHHNKCGWELEKRHHHHHNHYHHPGHEHYESSHEYHVLVIAWHVLGVQEIEWTITY